MFDSFESVFCSALWSAPHTIGMTDDERAAFREGVRRAETWQVESALYDRFQRWFLAATGRSEEVPRG